MENSWASIGKKIKLLRKVKNIKTKDIAAAAGISSISNYYSYENGDSRFTPKMIESIASLLEVSAGELMSSSTLTLEDALKQSQIVAINNPNYSEIVINFLKNLNNFDDNIVSAIMILIQQITKNYEMTSNPRHQIFKSQETLLSKFKSMEELLENNAQIAEMTKDAAVKQEILALVRNFENSLTKMLQKAQKLKNDLN